MEAKDSSRLSLQNFKIVRCLTVLFLLLFSFNLKFKGKKSTDNTFVIFLSYLHFFPAQIQNLIVLWLKKYKLWPLKDIDFLLFCSR